MVSGTPMSWDKLCGQACDPKVLFILADQEMSSYNYLKEGIKLQVNMKNAGFPLLFHPIILKVAFHSLTEGFQTRARPDCQMLCLWDGCF